MVGSSLTAPYCCSNNSSDPPAPLASPPPPYLKESNVLIQFPGHRATTPCQDLPIAAVLALPSIRLEEQKERSVKQMLIVRKTPKQPKYSMLELLRQHFSVIFRNSMFYLNVSAFLSAQRAKAARSWVVVQKQSKFKAFSFIFCFIVGFSESLFAASSHCCGLASDAMQRSLI